MDVLTDFYTASKNIIIPLHALTEHLIQKRSKVNVYSSVWGGTRAQKEIEIIWMSETYSMTLGSTRQRRKGMQSSEQAFKYKTQDGWWYKVQKDVSQR